MDRRARTTLSVACAVLSASFCAAAGENLLRTDFQPDNIGGVLGWSAGGDSNVRMELTPLKPEKPGDPNGVRIVGHRLGVCSSDYKFQSAQRLPLIRGQKYRLSVQVRTHGFGDDMQEMRFIIAEAPWQKGQGLKRLPGDTHGEWVELSWEGELKLPDTRGDYTCVLYCCSSRKGFPDNAWIDLRAPCLEGPVKPSYDKSKLMNLVPFPVRVTPVDPLLSEIDSGCASMLFYCPAAVDAYGVAGERKLLRATAADRTVTAPFGADGRAKATFGPMAPGKIELRAELVGAESGKVYASNSYRAHVRAKIAGATPMKRLNNFVSEMVRRPYAEGDVEFVLAKDTCMYVALTDAGAKVEARFDGEAAEFYPEAGGLEIMRRLPRGRHVLSLKGRANGELIVRSIKSIYRSALHKAMRMSRNFTDYNYGEDFFRTFGLFGGMNATSVHVANPLASGMRRLVGMMEKRGVMVNHSYGRGSSDSRRDVFEDYLAYVTNQPSYVAGLDGQFDENSISLGQGARSKANSTEVWWHAYAQGRKIDIFFNDGAYALHRYPHLDIPELSAYVNSGDGRSKMLAEVYYRSPETQTDFDRTVAFAKRQFKTMRELVPAAPSRFFYLFNGWMMIGGWTSWHSTGTDMRAFNAEMLRIFATDPDFAEMGGAAFSTPACYEDFFRFACAMLRYYCIEGGTESFAKMNGMEVWPRHIENGDFTDGFDGWTAISAEPGSLSLGNRADVGHRWQGRQYPAGYGKPSNKCPGCDFAVFGQSTKGPNILRRKISGLEPGRVYQLTCAVSDLATMNKGMDTRKFRKVKPVNIPYMRIRIEGAEEIPELYHVFDDIGKYGKRCVFPHRVVFRAKTSEAEAVFSDWKETGGPAVAPGQKTMLNYIGVYPYFHQGEAQLEELKRFTQQAKKIRR